MSTLIIRGTEVPADRLSPTLLILDARTAAWVYPGTVVSVDGERVRVVTVTRWIAGEPWGLVRVRPEQLRSAPRGGRC